MNKLSEDTKKSDTFILNKLKKYLKIKDEETDDIMILEKQKLKEIYNIIEKRKSYIFSLFDDNFSKREQEIKEELFYQNPTKNSLLDAIADNILNKRINTIFDSIINDENLSSWTRIVAIDRKLFINFLLEGPIKSEKNKTELHYNDR